MENEFKYHQNNKELYHAYHVLVKEIQQKQKQLIQLNKKIDKLKKNKKYKNLTSQLHDLEKLYCEKEKMHIKSNCSSLSLALELNRILSTQKKLKQQLDSMEKPYQDQIQKEKESMHTLKVKLLVIEYKALGVSEAMYALSSPKDLKAKQLEIENRRAEIQKEFRSLNIPKGIYINGDISKKCTDLFKIEIASTAKSIKPYIPSTYSANKIQKDRLALNMDYLHDEK